ncbi:MAG: hypothetical protein QFB87_05155 [Patescibacteria group bacterium]|nr:hypothetical protein [Patescibacteria group bacterium]
MEGSQFIQIESTDLQIVSVDENDVVTREVTELLLVSQGEQGPPGRDGTSGASAAIGAYIAGTNIQKAQLLYIARTGNVCGVADAAFYTKSFIIGFALETVAAGFPVDIATGRLAMTDWTFLTGQALLVTGVPYFLAVGGGLTTVTPSKPNSAVTVLVGVAASPNVLIVNPSPPILI